MNNITNSDLPLRGIRIVYITANISGPYGGAILADLGADVLKIESPSGDPARKMVPLDGDRSAYFHVVNRNKEVEVIDPKPTTMKDKKDHFSFQYAG